MPRRALRSPEMAGRAASFGAFLRLSRPHFLLGGALMYAIGAAHAENVELGAYLVGQLTVTAAQVTAHYVNEYADVEPDRAVVARTWFSGGSGVLSSGTLLPRVAMRSAIASSAVAIAGAAVLAFASPLAAVLGLLALGYSWAYSMPPLRLLGSGFGELGTSLVVTVVVPVMGALAQGEAIPSPLWWSVAPLLLIHMAMMLGFELPDLSSDAASGKRVLAVRIGLGRTLGAISTLYTFAAALSWVASRVGDIGASSAAAGTLAALVAAGSTPPAVRHQRWQLLTTLGVGALVVAGTATLLATI